MNQPNDLWVKQFILLQATEAVPYDSGYCAH